MSGRAITRRRVRLAWFGLQDIVDRVPATQRGRVGRAMRVLDDIHTDMRRIAVYQAGQKAKKPTPRFEGQDLGSMEAMTFYDGYASKHPGFKNPYRRTW